MSLYDFVGTRWKYILVIECPQGLVDAVGHHTEKTAQLMGKNSSPNFQADWNWKVIANPNYKG